MIDRKTRTLMTPVAGERMGSLVAQKLLNNCALILAFGVSASLAHAQTQITVFTKNAQGQIASVTDAQGNKVDYQYDPQGNLVRTNAAGSITTLQYDLRGNKIAMQDPAMGNWTYGYNAFGELVTQRDSLNQTTTLAYDVLGRMIKRIESDLVSDWSYDKKFDGTSCGKSIGKLCEAKTDNSYKRTHTYDSLGRLASTATVLDSVSSPAVVSESFDTNTGRVATKTWPTGYQVNYSYTPLGYLNGITGGGTANFPSSASYQVLGMTPHGKVTKYRTGNNVTVIKTFDPLVEREIGQVGTTDGQAAGNVINQAYRFNALGNLLARIDSTLGVGTQESFSYDSLNRLTTATLLGGAVSPPSTTEVMYDSRGNITYKSDVGRYWYDSVRPNRMINVTLETAPGATIPLSGTRALSYAFDDSASNAQSINGSKVGNGNLTYTAASDTVNNIHTVRFENYTSFNMPAQIVYGNYVTNTSNTSDRTLTFLYGPEHQRIKENVALSGNGTSAYFSGNTWYLNGEDSLGLTYEKEVRSNGTTEHKHYLTAQGETVALFISRTGILNGLPATTTSYFHKDQLGSIAAITDEAGAVTERFAYDPWGKRRFIKTTPGLPDKLDQIVGQSTDRGYTEHEHLDEVGVIHMNGRVYDPLMGRFMSADPHVTDPSNLQNYNRYAYVLNNPLVYTDPSGYEPWGTATNSDGDTVRTQFGDTGNGTVSNSFTGNVSVYSPGANSSGIGNGVAATDVAGPAGGGTGVVASYSSGGWSLTSFGETLSSSNHFNFSLQYAIAAAVQRDPASTWGGPSRGWLITHADAFLASEQLEQIPVKLLTALTESPAFAQFLTRLGASRIRFLSGKSADAAKVAIAPVEKFSQYIFKEGATHGKDAVFRSLGYDASHSAELAVTWEAQAASKYAKGEYTLGKLDQFGQRIDIGIELQGIGEAAGKVSNLKSGWMVLENGTIRLNTPFSGFVK